MVGTHFSSMRLLHLYLAMSPAKELFEDLKSSDHAWASVEVQGAFVREVLTHPMALKYPPLADYRKVLLRLYIDAVARTGDEYDDDLMELYSGLMQCASASQQQHEGLAPPPYYRSFFLDDGTHMTLQLRKGFGAASTGGTGAALWEAGLLRM